MGKQGPCYHCGITTTPLWRNGPPDKPVLCNACGSRWRTKGTLVNYMPMHSGGFGAAEKWAMKNANRSSDNRMRSSDSRMRSSDRSSDRMSHKRKEPDGVSDSVVSRNSNNYFSTSVDEDASTIGSEISTFDGPIGGVRGTPWDTPVPSRRRTNMFRSRAPSDKLAKSHMVSTEEQEVSSVTCPSSNGILLDTKSPLVAVEIGLGSVLIKHPAASQQQEQESEVSSLLIDSEVRSDTNNPRRGKDKQTLNKKPDKNKTLLENFPYNKRDVVQSVQSPLVYLDLKDIVNFDTFTGLLTDQEQHQLMKYLSSVDTSQSLESLRSLFSSAQLEGALINFQGLIREGMFDSSSFGLNPRVLQHYHQLLSVTNLTASGWMDNLSQLQTRTTKRRFEIKDKVKGPENTEISSPSKTTPVERTGDSKFNVPRQASSFGTLKAGNSSAGNQKSTVDPMEEGHDSGGEQDLLVDVPSRMSFHDEALLLRKPSLRSDYLENTVISNKTNVIKNSNVIKNEKEVNRSMGGEFGDLIITNTWHMDSGWDTGLISNPSRGGRRVLPNGTVLNP